MRALLEAGAHPDDLRAARSPLILAITSLAGGTMHCNIPMVKVLISHGADPNRADPMIGSLPLHTALEVGDADCAALTRAAGGGVHLQDDRGHTVLTAATSAATRTGNTGLVDMVLAWGIDPNTRDRDGSTALHEAAWDDSFQVAKHLLARGTDPCLPNGIGQTPVQMAENLHRPNMKKLIELLTPVSKCRN